MFKSGLTVVIFGFGMVFVVLFILILLIRFISFMLKVLIKEKPAAEVPAPAPVMAQGANDLTPEALAAVTCALAESLHKDAGQLIIRSVKRV